MKTLKNRAEEARISVRQRRDDIRKRIQSAEREGEISEDQKFFQNEKLEKLIETINKKLSGIAAEKEKEIMEV